MPAPNPIAIFAPGFNRLGLQWMAVGSIASNAYGEFRVTNDIDLILILDSDAAAAFSSVFPETEFYCPPADVIAIEASRDQRGHFNLIHHQTGFKADIYIAQENRIRWALERRRKIETDDTTVWIAPPEYVIIGKLEFYREGGTRACLGSALPVRPAPTFSRPARLEGRNSRYQHHTSICRRPAFPKPGRICRDR